MLISVYTNYGWKEFWLAVMKKYLLGIDVGTTGTKTLLFRADGQLIGHAYEAYPLLTPQVGWSEQRAEDWWQAVVHTVRQVCEDPDVAKNVAGISLSLQGGTFVPTDADGRALRPAIVWNDERTAKEREAFLREVGTDEDMYQKTGWPKSTIHGLLSTMRESGLIEQTPNGRYWLGIRLFEYGCAVSNSWDIGAIARPHMQNICAELGESVFLSVFDRAAVVTLAEEESRASLRVVSEVGARLPVHCTSQGKLFLANSSPAECRRILTHTELKAYTPHTLTTPEQFAPELTRIREQGYAVENGEYKIGLRSVSAPIHDVTGEVRYAIGCVGMFRQVQSDEFLHAIRLVCAAADTISRAIGYHG